MAALNALDAWYYAVRWPAPVDAPRSGRRALADLSTYAALLVWGFVSMTPCSFWVLGDGALLLWFGGLPLGVGLTCNAAVLRVVHALSAGEPRRPLLRRVARTCIHVGLVLPVIPIFGGAVATAVAIWQGPQAFLLWPSAVLLMLPLHPLLIVAGVAIQTADKHWPREDE